MWLRIRIVLINLAIFIVSFAIAFTVVLYGLNTEYKKNYINEIDRVSSSTVTDIINVLQNTENSMTGTLQGSNVIDATLAKELFLSKSIFLAYTISKNNSNIDVIIFSNGERITPITNKDFSEINFTEISYAAKGQRSYIIRKVINNQQLFFAFPVKYQNVVLGEVLFITPLKDADNTSWNFGLLFLASFAIGIAFIFLASIAMSNSLVWPIINLRNIAIQITSDISKMENNSSSGFNYNFTKQDYFEKLIYGALKHKKNYFKNSKNEIYALTNAFVKMTEEIQRNISIISIERTRLKSIIDSMGEGVVAFNNKNEIIAINDVASNFLDDDLKEKIINNINYLDDTSTVFEWDTADSHVFVFVNPLFSHNIKEGVVVVINDVTEIRQLQDKQKLFITNISHELRTPLTVILGYIDLLKEKGSDKKIFDTCLSYLEDSGLRLQRLISDLLDLASLSYSEFEVTPSSTNLAAITKNIIEQMRLKARKYNINIEQKITDVGEIIVDQERIRQVIVNIIDNSIKYSPGGTIVVSLKRLYNKVELTISDNGCGIPDELTDKIFEPFYRTDSARSRRVGGTGLGLSISKEIIEKHKGTLSLTSKEGVGTTVRILLLRDFTA